MQTAQAMLNDLVRNEALNDYQRKQIERIIKVAYEEGRLMEFRINNNINRNIDNND